jgi:hypothetical protein
MKSLLVLVILSLGQIVSAQDLNKGKWFPVFQYSTQSVVDFASPRLKQLGKVDNCVTKSGDPCAIFVSISTGSTGNWSPLTLSGESPQFKPTLPGTFYVIIRNSLSVKDEYHFSVPLTDGYIAYKDGVGNVDLKFGDARQTVTLGGSIFGNQLSGNITFQNLTSSQGPEVLGRFETRACDTFVCQ